MNILHRDKKKDFRCTARLKAILIGTLLGDGNLNRRGKDYRLLVKHGKSQYKFIAWKREELTDVTGMRIHSFEQRVKGKMYEFCQFVTLTHPLFTGLHHLFYRKGVKVVPKNIDVLLKHPISLAVWIMDDGARAPNGMTIQTHSFSEYDVKRLQKTLRKNFGIVSTLHKNKNKKVLYILRSEIAKLQKLVQKFILPEFRYKFPNPVETVR